MIPHTKNHEKIDINTYLKNSWGSNGESYIFRDGNQVFFQASVRNGTTDTILSGLPNEYRPTVNTMIGAVTVDGAIGYIVFSIDGTVKCNSALIGKNIMFTASYLNE